ncbi:thioesterase family protein domain protein [gamma proteobacterium HTCC5015]|nr:thioesterase family protein domain protein [gamma proteobacterium HTCC5015]
MNFDIDNSDPIHSPHHYLKVAEHFVDDVPHCRDLGVSVVEAKHGEVLLKLPYREDLLGDTERGLIHGGVLTSLIDNASGLSVFCSLPEMEAIATLDLRLDNMRPGVAGEDIYAWARCYRLTSQVAFVRSVAYQQRHLPLATSSSAFMRASSNKSFMSNKKGQS